MGPYKKFLRKNSTFSVFCLLKMCGIFPGKCTFPYINILKRYRIYSGKHMEKALKRYWKFWKYTESFSVYFQYIFSIFSVYFQYIFGIYFGIFSVYISVYFRYVFSIFSVYIYIYLFIFYFFFSVRNVYFSVPSPYVFSVNSVLFSTFAYGKMHCPRRFHTSSTSTFSVSVPCCYTKKETKWPQKWLQSPSKITTSIYIFLFFFSTFSIYFL